VACIIDFAGILLGRSNLEWVERKLAIATDARRVMGSAKAPPIVRSSLIGEEKLRQEKIESLHFDIRWV
jgi:hypothetical protein